ncbi:MAG: BatA domain-containing protein [Acidobacteria bacterium]|nr:BatA domain-containing protein [Acidobacteriota bacterium]
MQFLNPWFLLGALTVIAPILVHLIRKDDSRKIPFSSLMFVTRLPKKSLRRQSLRHLLLLLLRIAALILLALAFSRPFLVSKVAAPLRSLSDKSSVVLLDNSFSMQFGDRFEKAKGRALKILDSLTSRDTVQVVAYSDSTTVLNNLQTDLSALRSLIAQLRPSHRKTSHLAALKLAQQLLSSAPNDRLEIHWISDFQQTGWAESAEETTLTESAVIRPIDVAEEGGSNLSVNQTRVSQVVENDSPLMRVSAQVLASGMKSSSSARIVLELNGKRLQEKEVPLERDDSKLVEFSAFSLPPGLSKGEIKLEPPDGLPGDNVYHFTLNSLRKLRLLLLHEKGTQDSFYIAKALSATKDSPFQVELQDIGQGDALDLTRFSGALLSNVSRVPSKLAGSIAEFVRGGGGLVIALGSRARTSNLSQALEKVMPASLNKPGTSSENKTHFIGEMQKRHPVFEGFQPVHHSYFMTTPFSGIVPSKPQESSTVLASLEDGTPLLIERTFGKGRSLLFTSSFNMDWNDLPLKSVFLPFLHQLVKYSAHYDEEQNAFAVGDVVPMSTLNPMLGKALNKLTVGSFSQSWQITTPAGQKTELADADLMKSPFFPLEEPGFYLSRIHNFDNAVAVNVVAAESDLRKVAPEKILASLRRVGRSNVASEPAAATSDQQEAWESKQRIWWYLLMLALVVLVVESFLSNRYYKGVHAP